MANELPHLSKQLAKGPPYKLLALDGGGIRGIITVEVLAAIERKLQQVLDKDNTFVLADYFDYIGGTSTGAVIATCLSLGMRIDTIRQFYLDSAELMFSKSSIFKRLKYKFEDEPLALKLRAEFQAKTGETGKNQPTLGSHGLKTLLTLIMRNATTDSPWALSNNPYAKYNDRQRADCNLDLPLWQLVRASTAAPTYFPPEQIVIGKHNFIFVDGGITTYNNPAFQLFLMATAAPYRIGWKTHGPEDMLVVSIGTGTSPQPDGALEPDDMNLLFNASTIPSALMFAALNEQDFLCRVFGQCLAGDSLDRELGDLIGSHGPLERKLFTYLRYNAELTPDGLGSLGLSNISPAAVQKMDSVAHKDDLRRVGEAIAKAKVQEAHFERFFSL